MPWAPPRCAMISGDRAAFVEWLAGQQGQKLRRFLRSRVRNSADVPDLIQEVFLRLLRVPNYETIRTPEAYLFTIAQHVVQQHGLQASRRNCAVELSLVLAEVTADVEADPSLVAIAQQGIDLLDRALRQLPPKVQATFLLCRRDGLSTDEASARLGISRPMVKKYLVKALVHFRKRLYEAE